MRDRMAGTASGTVAKMVPHLEVLYDWSVNVGDCMMIEAVHGVIQSFTSLDQRLHCSNKLEVSGIESQWCLVHVNKSPVCRRVDSDARCLDINDHVAWPLL